MEELKASILDKFRHSNGDWSESDPEKLMNPDPDDFPLTESEIVELFTYDHEERTEDRID